MNIADNVTFRKDMYMALAQSSKSPIGSRTDSKKSNVAGTSDQKFEFRATQREPEVIANLRKAAALLNMDMADFARESVNAAFERVQVGQPIRGEIDRAMLGTDQFRAPYLSAVPCGPWKEAVDTASTFVISRDTADELESKDGDVWIRAEGQSMDEVGIADGCMVLIRPGRSPKRGEAILIQVTQADGNVVGALKTFDGMDAASGLPRLLNGDGSDYKWPKNVERYDIVGRAVAQMGRL